MPNNKDKLDTKNLKSNLDFKESAEASITDEAGRQDALPEDAAINPRPTLKANIERHILSVPKESSDSPNIIKAYSFEDSEGADEKTKRIISNTASVKRISLDENTKINIIQGAETDEKPADEDDLASEKTRNIKPAQAQEIYDGEKSLEMKLKESRREIAKDFVLDEGGIPYTRDLPEPPETDIFQISNKNRRLASKHLIRLKKIHILKTAAIAIIGLILLLFAFLASNLKESSFANKHINFVFVNFLLLFVVAAIGQEEVLDGFKALKNRSPNFNSFIGLLWSGAILQSIVFLAQPSVIATGLQLANAAAVILSLPAFIARYLTINRALRHMKTLTSRDEISVVAKISNDEFGYGLDESLIEEGSCIHFNAKTKSLNNFIDNILKSQPLKKVFSFLLPIFIFVPLFLALIVFIKERDIYIAVTALALSLTAILPSSLTLSLAFLLFTDNMSLSKYRAAVFSFEAAESKSISNSVILDAKDIFPDTTCQVHGIVPYNKMRIDTAIIYVSAMLIEADGPLSGLFNRVILDRDDILPEVESLIYEDRLGLSAWIDDKIILVGTLDHLKHHNVKLPAKDFYSKHCIGDRKPLFLAVEGVLAAMFVVSYIGEDLIVNEVKKLTDKGVTLLVSTSDPNLSESFIEKTLELEPNTVKIINQKMSESYKNLKINVSQTIEAENLHDGTSLSFLKTINMSDEIVAKKSISVAASLIFSLISLLLISIFLFAQGGIAKVGSIQIVLFHLFWNILGLLVPKILTFLPKR